MALYLGSNKKVKLNTSTGLCCLIVPSSTPTPTPSVPSSTDIIFEVKKIVSNTYAAETTYENEEFILIDVYPKSGGTVNITYGGLTKTIVDDGTSDEPNAQQVFFGTFNGVTDDVETPANGTLIIDGDYRAANCGSYTQEKLSPVLADVITSIISFGSSEIIYDRAFDGCINLTSVAISDSIASINPYAFCRCSNLTSVTISENSQITSIGEYAFYECTSLTSINISDSVMTIGQYAFCRCSNLTSATIGSGVTSIDNYAFKYCQNLTSIIIPDSVTSIGYEVFQYCTNLTDVTIGHSVTTISQFMFGDCTNLTSVIIPDSVTRIDQYVFQNCTSLTSITIPKSVTSIGNFAFQSCSSLTSVTMLSETPPTISTSTWGTVGIATIIVPVGCGATYKATEGWSEYADYIVEVS